MIFIRFIILSYQNELLSVDSLKTDNLLGIFAASHLDYEILRNENQPSLLEMTLKALEILMKNENGFVLLVEGGRIDHAHHDTIAQRALIETYEFSKTIDYVKKLTNEDETLIVVTADHGHVFNVGGYAVSQSHRQFHYLIKLFFSLAKVIFLVLEIIHISIINGCLH